jgi:hypothetical protein
MKVWYAHPGDSTITMLTPDGWDRPEEHCLQVNDLEKPQEAYMLDWTDGSPRVVENPDYPEAKLALERSLVWERIKAERDRRKEGGFKVGDKWFHSDASSRLRQVGLVMAGAAVPAILWKTMDGSFVTMTPVLAQQIFQAGFTLDTALFARAEQHKAAMEASADPLSYNYLTGWPERYEDGL